MFAWCCVIFGVLGEKRRRGGGGGGLAGNQRPCFSSLREGRPRLLGFQKLALLCGVGPVPAISPAPPRLGGRPLHLTQSAKTKGVVCVHVSPGVGLSSEVGIGPVLLLHEKAYRGSTMRLALDFLTPKQG